MKIHISALLYSAAALSMVAAPHAIANPLAQAETAPLVTTQLPRNAVPSHYAITVTPNAENLTFSAKVAIDIAVKVAGNAITLNAADLNFGTVTIKKLGMKPMAANVKVDADAQTATFTFPKNLAPGNYTLNLDYAGKIYQQANGLFALDYTDTKGAQKRALFTQFEAPDARRFVPSWDEPNYKASFDLSVTVPADQMAVSNMPAKIETAKGASKQVVFQTTPKMSTYLLFFGLGEFDRIAKQAKNTQVGVIMGRGNADKGQYALDASAKIVDYYDDYFGVPFPLPKLDNVAGPGQSQFFSAMENWGAIFTFERVLLDDPKITSARGKQRIFAVDAHEIAHQWFGDLVTMQWWDDLWLNEGFASWMESKTTEHFYPEWQADIDRVYGREAAIGLDAYATAHPIIQNIKTVEQTSQAFDTITYEKGQAVITMLESYAGPDVWRSGIRSYIKKHAYGNTRTDDLWTAVEDAGAKGLTKIAHDFTKKPGVPLISVTGAKCENGNTIVTFAQGEFSRDRMAETMARPARWDVPVLAQILGNGTGSTIVSGGTGSLTLSGCGTLLVNPGASGYYRTLYQNDQIASLRTDFAKLAPIDQVGLLNDSESLSRGEYQDMAVSLDLLNAVPANASARVAEDALGRIATMNSYFREDATRQNQVATIADARFSSMLVRLGMTQKNDEPTVDSNLRSSLIATLGSMKNPAVFAEASRLFTALDSDPAALDGPLRTSWLSVIAYNADKATWDKIHNLGKNAANQTIRSAMYSLLGSAKDKVLAQAALDLALSGEAGPTISPAIISEVAGEHPDMAVDFVLAHLSEVEKMVDVSSRSSYLARLGNRSVDPAMPEKLDSYAKTHLSPESRKPVDQAIAAINARIAALPRIKAGVGSWLDKNTK